MKSRRFLLSIFLLLACVCSAHAQSQSIAARISILDPSRVSVTIESGRPSSNWSFRNVYAGALGLGERIEHFQAKSDNVVVPVKTLAAGEFQSERPTDSVSYIVNVSPRNIEDVAHVSCMNGDYGVIMPGDLLPRFTDSKQEILIGFDLPAGWVIRSSLEPVGANEFLVKDPGRALFLVGRDIRLFTKKIKGMELRVVASGVWAFDDHTALRWAGKVLSEYADFTNFKLRERPTVVIAPLPLHTGIRWKAETRGSTVLLLLNPRASVRNWKAQLAVILTHEVFHLWVPNSLALSGDYDWFFEGFTSYVALQAALKLKLIRFDEYLATLGRVYDSYRKNTTKRSLLDESATRWTSSGQSVYDHGMLVAFAYDLVSRQSANDRLLLQNCYRYLLAQYADEPVSANDVIIKLLTASSATEDFAKSYIESEEAFDLPSFLPFFGIEVDAAGATTHLTVSRDLSSEQKRLLRSLGYRM